jgi:hypothetical protein
MRLERGALHLGLVDVPALIRAATPLDPSRMNARAFPPAIRYIAAVGHVLRARRDPRAWIREMGFDFRIDALLVRGPQDELEELARLITQAVQPSDLPLPLIFAYEDTGLDDNERHYTSTTLVTISSAEAATLFDEAESRELLASHQAAMLRSFAEFFDDWLSGHHLEIADAAWSSRVHGIRYELVLKTEHARRSPLEAPRPVAQTGIRAIFGRASTEFDPYRSASLLDAEALRALFTREREQGAQVRTNVQLRNESWRFVLLAADGRQAVGVNAEGLGYRLTGAMALDLRERGLVELAPHAPAGAPRS